MFLKGRIAHVSSGIAPLWLKNWGWTTSVRSLSIDILCRFCGVQQTVDYINCLCQPCWSTVFPSPLQCTSVISGSTCIVTCRWGRTFSVGYCVKMFCCPASAATDSSLVPAAIFQTLMVTLVHSRLDYGNSVLVGIRIPSSMQRHGSSFISDRISDALASVSTLVACPGANRI